MHSTVKQITIKNSHDLTSFACSTELWNFLWKAWTRTEGRHYHFNSLKISAIGLKFDGFHKVYCYLKCPCLVNFCVFHGSLAFSMIGLDQVWGIKLILGNVRKITLWPGIWWHDAMYHEADHYFKWPRSANVHIFWSWPAEGAVILSICCCCFF